MATRKTSSGKSAVKKASPKKGAATTGKTKSTAVKKAKAPAAKAPGKAVAKAPAAKAPRKAAAKPSPKKQEGLQLASAVVNGILDRKGENVLCLDLRNIENAVCDYFIICEGNSNIQVEAIADSVEVTVKKELGERPYRSEGWENALWILIDYVNVVVHVFQRETRQFYNLESLWADAEVVQFGDAPGAGKPAKDKAPARKAKRA